MNTRRPLGRAGLPVAVVAALVSSLAAAQTPPSDPVLVENSTVKIRKSDYESELERLPAEIRPGFANSDRRINDLLRRLLIERTLAAQARAEKLDQDPRYSPRLNAEVDKLYGQLKVASIENDAAAEFEAKRGTFEQRAREIYTVDRKKYVTPEQLQASHILFETRTRPAAEARKLADDARARVLAGADFNALAREISEDRSAKTNSGRLDWFQRSEMDPAFADAAFALAKPGDVSMPVLSSFGWHIVRLDARRAAVERTYDEVRDAILAELKQKYVNDVREAAVTKLRNDPSIRANREAIDALTVRVDQDVRRAAEQGAKGAPTAPAQR